MKRIKNSIIHVLALMVLFMGACKDLDELNINPNGVDPEVADLNLLLPTILTGVGQTVVNLGFGDLSGVMQHTQLDGWSGGHNDYDWNNLSHNWSGHYGILRNNNEFKNKAVEGAYEFHQGVALVMGAYTFGLITDLWGDAPYTDALKAEEGADYFQPVFDNQKDIYIGILDDLEAANNLLSGSNDSYTNISATQDVLYGGNVMKWRRFANALALRYYMRLSAKEPTIAEQGIRRITSDPSKYPLITQWTDDANIGYVGNSPSDSWPTTIEFDPDPSGNYMRKKMCATLVEIMQAFNDPRLGVWANKIEIPIVLISGTGIDRVVDGRREISQDVANAYEATFNVSIDFDPEYVGIPPSIFTAPQYNMNPNLDQGVYNPHCSQLNDIYKQSDGALLQMRLMSAAEVHFILAEAAIPGWAPGTAEEHYAAGIQQSMNAWGVGSAFNDYIAGAPYNGLESIITQKWIASWTAAAESWFDYRRTGFPVLQTGESARRQALPLRFYYHFDNEISKNPDNAEAAIQRLEATQYKGSDVSNNSAWSKMWLIQGTGKPY